MNRGIIVLALIAFSAYTVKADATDMMLSVVEHIQGTAEQCLSTHGLSLDFSLISSFDNFGRALKSGLACILRALNIIDENGNLNVEFLQSLIPEGFPFRNIAETVMKDCSKPQTSAPEGAYNLVKCVFHEQIMKTTVGKLMNKASRFAKMFLK